MKTAQPNAFFLQKVLQNAGLAVETAQNGRHALEKLKAFSPDVVVSDIMMPEMDGLTLARELKTSSEWQHLPLVLMTTLNEPEEIVSIINSGADYLFLKEFDPQAFQLFIEDVLKSGQRVTSPGAQTLSVAYLSELREINASSDQLVTLLFSTYRSALFASQRYYQLKMETRQAQSSKATDKPEEHATRTLQIRQFIDEIRTPLHNVVNLLELLKEMDDRSEREIYTQLAFLNSDHITVTLNDLQKLIDFHERKPLLPFRSIDFNLRECIEDTVSPFTVSAGRKNIDLITRIPTDLPETFSGDPNYLRHVLFILLDNACRASEGGEILIEVTPLEQNESRTNLQIKVEDHGSGLKSAQQKDLKKLFETTNLEKIPGSLQQKYPGLFIAKQLVSAAKGNIHFKTSKSGTAFYFTLTLQPARASTDMIGIQGVFNLKNMRALIFAPQWISGVVLEELLKSWQMDPKIIDDPEKILPTLEQANLAHRPFQLLILDSRPQTLEHFEIARKIRENNNFKNVKIVLLTNFGRPGDAQRCVEAGISAFLLKPVKARDLLHTLQSVLQLKPEDSTLITRHSLKEAARPLRILVAEDNRVNQKLMLAVLKRAGFEVELAANGAEAVDLFKQKTFDLILMDMQMPVMDGFEATRQIRKLEKEKKSKTPIFALTASEDPKEIQGALKAGIDKVLKKPLNINELKKHIETIMRNNDKLLVEF